jgi:hypothetical protein
LSLPHHRRDEHLPLSPLAEACVRIDPRIACLVAAGCIGMFVLFGALQLSGELSGPGTYRLFALDAEWNAPALFSGCLILGASIAAFALADFSSETHTPTWLNRSFGLLLAYMTLDEVLSFHERLEAWTGVDWQLLYLPACALAAGVWLGLARCLRQFGSGYALLVSGAFAWAIAQVFQLVQWGGFNSDRIAHA